MRLTYTITGTEQIKKNLAAFSDEVDKTVKDVVFVVAVQGQDAAKAAAPVDMGLLKANIVVAMDREKKGFKANIISLEKYSAFMEFGTGPQVHVEPEFKKIAEKFKGPYPGTFDEGMERIKLWLNHQGGDPDMAFVVFMSILKRGLKPHQFMFKGYQVAKDRLPKDIKFAVDQVVKKYNSK